MPRRPSDCVGVNVTLTGFSRIDFDMRTVRKGLTSAGKLTKREARRLVARRAISGAGEFPGRQSGKLMRSITTVSRGSNWIKIGPKRITGMNEFYPAFLYYGSKKTNLKKRGNYMTEALRLKRESVRSILREALFDALKPR